MKASCLIRPLVSRRLGILAVFGAVLMAAGSTLAATPRPTPTGTHMPSPTPASTPTPISSGQSCSPFGNPPAKLFANVVPKCKGGTRLGPLSDRDGTPRYACVYEPSQASATNPLPLVVFLHAPLATADSIQSTNLLSLLSSADVSESLGASVPFGPVINPNLGFILLAPEARDIQQFFPLVKTHGTGFDYWYRQLSPAGDVTVDGTLYEENVDAAAIDDFIAQEVATGKVDTNRVFVTGWSTGASMAYLYGLSRPNVAALAAYSAVNPFEAFNDPCPQVPVVGAPADNTQLQIYNAGLPSDLIHSNCDFAGLCPNGEFMASELLSLGIGTQDTIIDSTQMPANACVDKCGIKLDGDPSNKMANSTGAKNHLRWPNSWTPAILDFFRSHSLSERPH